MEVPFKASGPDHGISARLLKDAAPVIAKPITYLVNLTISTGLIPAEWKDARVSPIFKSGARNDVNNYRLISVLPLVSKIMERAIQVQFLAFLTLLFQQDLFLLSGRMQEYHLFLNQEQGTMSIITD